MSFASYLKMQEESSIQRQQAREARFLPPYCANPKCIAHRDRSKSNFVRNGHYKIKRFPYKAARYRCKLCKKNVSYAYFQLHFRQKIWGLNRQIFNFHILGVSKREIGRQVKHSERLVRLRVIKMSRWALLFQAKQMEDFRIEEPIVYDGLENFSYSQYDPNNLNHAVGKKSLFVYDFNLVPLNRKGRMSLQQKSRLRQIEHKLGRYPTNAIRTATTRIIGRMRAQAVDKLILYSDRHFQYERAVQEDLGNGITHIRVSSKLVRNYRNPLFAVNNIDLQARHNLAAFKRETIAFAKNSVAMLDSYILYASYRNYMRPKFWGTHRSDPESCKKSPAMELGIASKILIFKELFKERISLSQVRLNEDWFHIYQRHDPLSRRFIAYCPSI